MADVFAYLDWRGDIPFSGMWINDVDTLIFSALAYVHYDGVVTEDPRLAAPLRTVARTVLALPDAASRCRCENDLALLKAAGESERFGRVGVTCYRNVFDPEEETQFAAISFLLEDGTAILAFRGTDSSLVGWKEDFNMTFQESVPAQRLAKEYVTEFAENSPAYMITAGHSKGGNLAVYAAAKCAERIQERVIRVCNFDGPGFTRNMILDPGYQRIVPRIRKLVPQSSVFGMLLEQEEDYTVIRSKSVGIFQHDPYSWEVMGPGFVPGETLTADSRFLDKTFKTWLAGMNIQERNEFFDTVFGLLMMDNASSTRDVIRPQHLKTILRTVTMDEEKRRIIGSVLSDLVDSARNTHSEMTEQLSTGADEQR